MKIKKLWILLLAMLCLLTACKEDETPTDGLYYGAGVAFYTEEGATQTMQLSFMQEVAAGSEIKLLNGETELVSFTTENAFTGLTISAKALELNVPYTLTVNGVTQQHSTFSAGGAAIGEITVPEQPTVPVEPMNEPTEITGSIDPTEITVPEQPAVPVEPMSEPAEGTDNGGFTPGAGSMQGGQVPPEGEMPSEGQMPIVGEIPSEGLGGELPDVGFTPGQGMETPEIGTKPSREQVSSSTEFTLTQQVQGFYSICDAV